MVGSGPGQGEWLPPVVLRGNVTLMGRHHRASIWLRWGLINLTPADDTLSDESFLHNASDGVST